MGRAWLPVMTALACVLGSALPAAAAGPAGPVPVRCAAPTGPYQGQLEIKLGLRNDGVQSATDCAAIRKLQRRLGVRPADGKATLKTYRLLLVDEARRNPNARKRCPVRRTSVTCVDLGRQILWVQRGAKVVFGPVPMRSGRNGLETRRGWHRVYSRHRTFFSTLYDGAPMPYAQFFSGGQAFHGTYKDLFTSGSGGCVNLYVKDAARLWKTIGYGSRVYVWGTKPGTKMRSSATSDEPGFMEDVLVADGFGGARIEPRWTADLPVGPAGRE
ncbi:L,D-transpeptidase [Streptomyces sp. NPDC001941]|uniref:L,D-transpeptidase n=1 Tax=Streptomyces sp. NPDC001941 TaxID=3154659 RepID=UPI003316D456